MKTIFGGSEGGMGEEEDICFLSFVGVVEEMGGFLRRISALVGGMREMGWVVEVGSSYVAGIRGAVGKAFYIIFQGWFFCWFLFFLGVCMGRVVRGGMGEGIRLASRSFS